MSRSLSLNSLCIAANSTYDSQSNKRGFFTFFFNAFVECFGKNSSIKYRCVATAELANKLTVVDHPKPFDPFATAERLLFLLYIFASRLTTGTLSLVYHETSVVVFRHFISGSQRKPVKSGGCGVDAAMTAAFIRTGHFSS